MTKSKVAIAKCESYEQQDVMRAVTEVVDLLGGMEKILSGGEDPLNKDSNITLKVNLLAKTPPEQACATHPQVFWAVGKLMQEKGYNNLQYGDSPGIPTSGPKQTAEGCGITEKAEEIGVPIGDFDHGTPVRFPDGVVEKQFTICNAILETDGVINLCKMKTHPFERITGAVKNTFGCVYGINKAAFHSKYTDPKEFAKMLADLNHLVSPKLHIMDGVLAMEGNGPQSGTPKKMNVILASEDPVALDAVYCHLVDLDPELVATNTVGMEQGIGVWDDIEVLTAKGSMTPEEAGEMYGDPSFKVERAADYQGSVRSVLGRLKSIRFLLEKKPGIIKRRCIGCGVCAKTCPAKEKAVTVQNGKARYDYDKCIKCYCCQEMCPEKAIKVKKPILARVADRSWRM